MRLVLFSHKPCWRAAHSPTGFATDGGFPMQVRALSELFDETRLLVPVRESVGTAGELPLAGHNLTLVPLARRPGTSLASKLSFLPWLVQNSPAIFREFGLADAVHAPIPGDVGTVGMLLAWLWRKPLFVRHCGNWLAPVTKAEKFWRWFMESTAGDRNVMLATGGTSQPPSSKNPKVHWIFSSSLTRDELNAYAIPRLYPANGQVRLIHVARQEPAKGAGTIIRSLPALLQSFPGLKLEIVGEGTAVPELKRLAQALQVAERVTFSGKLSHDQVMSRLRLATLFVFPTTSSDGFPKAVLEGLASGLPIIATRVSALPRLLSHGCGLLLDEATPEAVAAAVKSALASPSVYVLMSLAAIQTARTYSLEAWRDTIGRYLEAAWGPLKRSEVSFQKPTIALSSQPSTLNL